jgi:hypothetical protein
MLMQACTWRRLLAGSVVVVFCAAAGCGTPPAATSTSQVTPSYNSETGRLEGLAADRDGDGRVDTRAEMDGLHFKRVEIDRDGNGKADRWEYYAAPAAPVAAASPAAPPSRNELVRAEEANGPQGDRVTRREFYERGVIARIEEDTDADGRIDTWDWYEGGALVRMDLDLQGRGRADRRLLYGPHGDVTRVEVDTEGDGVFVPLDPSGAERKP